ncbi:MAG: hypothetical protein WBF53_04220 [Litorimonas sp.]
MSRYSQTLFAAGLASLLLMACSSPSPESSPALEISNDWDLIETESYRGKRDAVHFIDEQTGWYGTGAGDLFQTRDGGESWDRVRSQPGTFVRAVAFLDRDVGYIGNVGTDYYPGVTDETPLYRPKMADGTGPKWIWAEKRSRVSAP